MGTTAAIRFASKMWWWRRRKCMYADFNNTRLRFLHHHGIAGWSYCRRWWLSDSPCMHAICRTRNRWNTRSGVLCGWGWATDQLQYWRSILSILPFVVVVMALPQAEWLIYANESQFLSCVSLKSEWKSLVGHGCVCVPIACPWLGSQLNDF